MVLTLTGHPSNKGDDDVGARTAASDLVLQVILGGPKGAVSPPLKVGPLHQVMSPRGAVRGLCPTFNAPSTASVIPDEGVGGALRALAGPTHIKIEFHLTWYHRPQPQWARQIGDIHTLVQIRRARRVA